MSSSPSPLPNLIKQNKLPSLYLKLLKFLLQPTKQRWTKNNSKLPLREIKEKIISRPPKTRIDKEISVKTEDIGVEEEEEEGTLETMMGKEKKVKKEVAIMIKEDITRNRTSNQSMKMRNQKIDLLPAQAVVQSHKLDNLKESR